ncbi:MAG: hypothetical protein K5838_02145 [Elusimicrobiales bacterium]|nr:hypothetical protein [Elusimicrobiales bacterium]
MKKILLFLFSTLLLVANTFAAEPEPSYDYIFNEEDSDVKVSKKKNPTSEQKQALFIMNYARYAIYKIKGYNNIFAFEEEYSNLYNNLNLKTVADEEGVEEIRQLMDTLHQMRQNHKKADRLEASLQRKMQQALYDSFQPITTIVTAKANFLSIAINAISAGANMYMSYKKYKSQLLQEFDQSMFELELDREDRLNDAQTNLITVSHRLIHRYNMSDDWRIDENQIKKMLEYLDDADAGRSYRNLKNMSKGRFVQHFPTFWYNLAKKASEVGDSANAIKYYDRFEKENIPSFRTDKMAVDAYKGKIALMLKNKNYYKNEILEKLKYIEENTDIYDRASWLNYYFCVLVYSKMGRYSDAKRLLTANITDLSARVSREFEKQILIIADNKKDSKKEDNKNEIIHLADDLRNYYDALEINRAMLYNFDSKKDSKEKQFIVNSLDAEFKNGTASINEFIYLSYSYKAYKALKDVKFFYSSRRYKIYVHVPIQYVMNSSSALKFVIPGYNSRVYDMALDTEETYKINKRINKLKDYHYVYKCELYNGEIKAHNSYEIILQPHNYPIRFGFKPNKDLETEMNLIRRVTRRVTPLMPIYANIGGHKIELK